MKATKIVALVLGILGGLFGIGTGHLVMGLGGMGAIFGAEGVEKAIGNGLITIIFSSLGIIVEKKGRGREKGREKGTGTF
jgi:hypothetical protein